MTEIYHTTPAIHVDVWEGCYGASWNGLVVAEAYGHPAKFSRALISRIYEHVQAEGWLKPGDAVVDPFGGVALGARDALAAGCHWIGCELEPHFNDMGQGCDCTGISKAEWVRFYGRWSRVSHSDGRHWCPRCLAEGSQVTGTPALRKRTFRTIPRPGRKVKTRTVLFAPLPFPDRKDGVQPPKVQEQFSLTPTYSAAYLRGSGRIPTTEPHHYEGNTEKWAREGHGTARLVQGDSRQLRTVIQGQVELGVASPPFQASQLEDGRRRDPSHKGLINHRFDVRTNPRSPGEKLHLKEYAAQESPGNLSVLPPGSITAAISSPPYGEQQVGTGASGRTGWRGYTDFGGGTMADAAQLSAMPMGKFDAAIASPPYADGCTHTGGTDPQPQHIQGGAVHHVAYGTTPAQLGDMAPGSLDMACSSPPYSGSSKHDYRVTDEGGRDRDVRRGYQQGLGCFRGSETYGQTAGQLGHEESTTFWLAAKQVVAETYALLKPGGHAVWVVKMYCRNGQLVDFPGDWQKLCESCGFLTLHEHRALLTEDYGTQGGLFGADTQVQTARKSFFRRLAEAKGSPKIEWETILCMVKPRTAGEGQVACCVASPPYADSLQAMSDGIDWSHVEGGRRDRTQETNYHKNGGSGVTPQHYGTTPGQLGSMKAGDVDLCVSSPPYAGTHIAACEGNIGGGPGGRKASALTDVNGNIKEVGYGQTPGQLGSMRPGQPPTQEP